MADGLVAIHFWVDGAVQGVGFRYQAQREAEALGVHGWVRNLVDGRVEGIAEADTPSLQKFVDWLRHGPCPARVQELVVESCPSLGLQGFRVCGDA